MNRHEIRYFFEHKCLPKWFFVDKKEFVGALLYDKEVLFKGINTFFEGADIVNPYSPEEFKVEPLKVTDEVFLLKISFPEPEEEPLCYSAYMFFDDGFEKISYFCIEKGSSEYEDLPFVCSWTPDGVHHNHGRCSTEGMNDLIRCIDIHMEREYGMVPKSIVSDIAEDEE